MLAVSSIGGPWVLPPLEPSGHLRINRRADHNDERNNDDRKDDNTCRFRHELCLPGTGETNRGRDARGNVRVSQTLSRLSCSRSFRDGRYCLERREPTSVYGVNALMLRPSRVRDGARLWPDRRRKRCWPRAILPMESISTCKIAKTALFSATVCCEGRCGWDERGAALERERLARLCGAARLMGRSRADVSLRCADAVT
jgi:hypothetical protein